MMTTIATIFTTSAEYDDSLKGKLYLMSRKQSKVVYLTTQPKYAEYIGWIAIGERTELAAKLTEIVNQQLLSMSAASNKYGTIIKNIIDNPCITENNLLKTLLKLEESGSDSLSFSCYGQVPGYKYSGGLTINLNPAALTRVVVEMYSDWKEAPRELKVEINPEPNLKETNMLDALLTANKNALKTATKLEIGRAGNTALETIIRNRFPKLPDTPFNRVILANMASVAVRQFAGNNTQAVDLTNHMLIDAFQEAYDVLALDEIIKEFLAKAETITPEND